jgi:hypothetical protein
MTFTWLLSVLGDPLVASMLTIVTPLPLVALISRRYR